MKKYLIAIRLHADDGSIFEGNTEFNTDEPLRGGHLMRIKEIYAKEVEDKTGKKCDPRQGMILACIPLEA